LQGTYDGLGGILKNWIVQRKVLRLSFDPNDPTMRCPAATPETEGLMASAEECCSAWKNYFETDEWRADAAVSARKVKAFFFHWGAEGAIVRPASDKQFDRLVGISSSYQYFMLREGEVLMRSYSCWCPACFDVAVAGPGVGTRLNSQYEVYECAYEADPLYRWRNASFRAKTGPGASSPDQRAREQGRTLTVRARPGQWVLVEAFNDEVDKMWLRKTVAFGAFGTDACCKLHTEGQKNMYGTRFNTGDYMVAVHWYERLGESAERREFARGKRMIDVVNSTELRLLDF
jgi:hypothetical protein